VFGRGWAGIIAYLESLFDGNPAALIVALLAGLVVVRLLIMLLQGHGLHLAPLHPRGRP
jgi:hypothetical protein